MIREIVPFEIGHLDLLDMRGIDREMLGHWGEKYMRQMLEVASCSSSAAFYTVFVDGKAFFCGGVALRWPGVGEFWGVGSKAVDKMPMLFCSLTRTILQQLTEHYQLHRAEAHCWVGFPQSRKWLGMLGFKVEGVRVAWSPGRHDYYMMGKVI